MLRDLEVKDYQFELLFATITCDIVLTGRYSEAGEIELMYVNHVKNGTIAIDNMHGEDGEPFALGLGASFVKVLERDMSTMQALEAKYQEAIDEWVYEANQLQLL